MSGIRDRIYKILRESKISFMEGTSNFMLFDSPNLAFTDEDLEIDDLTHLFSKYNLPSWFKNTRNFETHLIDSDLNEDFAFVGARYGYYEGMNIGIVKNDEFEEWAYDNYEEIDGTYYEYNSDKPISKEELREEFDNKVEEQYQKGIEKLKELKEDYGGKFINVASRASNGETIYSQDNSIEKASNDSDMETTSDGRFKVGDLVCKGLNLGRIKRIYNVDGKDVIVLDTLGSYDAIEDPKGYELITSEKIQEFLSNQSLEEGWKDNLKKGVATLGVAGALAGNAMAHDPMYDGARRPFDDTNMTVQQVQQLSNEDEKATVLPNGMIKDQYGNEWTKEDWKKLMRGEDPFADNDDIHGYDEVDEFAKENGFMKNEDGTYTLDIDDSVFTKDELIDFMSKLDQGQ